MPGVAFHHLVRRGNHDDEHKLCWKKEFQENLVGWLEAGIGHFSHTELLMEGLGEIKMKKRVKCSSDDRKGRHQQQREGRGRVGEGVGQWLGREVQEERYSGI